MYFMVVFMMVLFVIFLLHRYDIKGCEVGRWTNPDTGGKQIIKVLKDMNFEGQYIALGKCPLPYTHLLYFFLETVAEQN